MKFNYSFSFSQPAPAKPKLAEYSYNEFLLDLPPHWRQLPTSEDNSFNFYSEKDGASITISADFYAIPDEKAVLMAEACLESRHAAFESQFPGQVEVLRRTARQHSGGDGIEMMYAADAPGQHLYFYLGYVTRRKILHFALVCQPGRDAAAALFNSIVSNFRPQLP
ncbi:hypothetical protein [Pseudoduganella sp.]|uniref:hypothetical protein n=1 Tax=Pseudoduganella sp. TaxID=1880898 RepID=UPI0035AEF302